MVSHLTRRERGRPSTLQRHTDVWRQQFGRTGSRQVAAPVKCFLHITPAEQVRRFKDRLTNPLKRWKLSYEDLRNRSRWMDYEVAIEDMMEKTSTKGAPWHLVPANDKSYGRLAAFTILIDRLGEGLPLEPRPLDPKIAEAAAHQLDLSSSKI